MKMKVTSRVADKELQVNNILKKNPKGFDKIEKEFYQNIKDKNLSYNLCNYVWKMLIYMQRSYGFNRSHTLSYSYQALQEMNLYYRFNPIYWNCANLIVDSGSMEETEDKSTDYGKVAVAVAKIENNNIKVELPLINEAEKSFVPKAKENRIIYSIKAINGIGDAAVEILLNNRPYKSFEDFCDRLIGTGLIKNAQMIKLIKAGCFNELTYQGKYQDRNALMKAYIEKYIFSPNTSLTMSNLNKIVEYGMLPEDLELTVRIIDFKSYVLQDKFCYKNIITKDKKIPKCGYHDRLFKTDNISTPFLFEHFSEQCIEKGCQDRVIISEKKFVKECNLLIQPLKDWLTLKETVDIYNKKGFQILWNKYAAGSMADWYMDSIGMYPEEHALEHINLQKYTIEHFGDLSTEPTPYQWYTRTVNGETKSFPKYKISRLCGTIVSNDPKHYMITLLTDDKQVVDIKFNKGQFAYYNRRISVKINPNSDKKTVLENSWLSRGTKIFVHGMRRGDKFFCKTYKDSVFKHTIYRIDNIRSNGEVDITTDRIQM